MLDREQLETFATVVEQGSFDRAALTLNVTRGAVSQRIKALEESLTTVLLLREKPVRPTLRGEALLRHVKALRVLEGATLQEVVPSAHARKPVSVALAVNADSLATWFAPIIGTLLARRNVALEIVSDDQDHTFPRLSRGEVIGCISTEASTASGFVAEPVGSMEYRCVASPSFAAEYFPRGLGLQAVLAAPAILFDRKDALHDTFLHKLFGFRVDRYARHYLPAPGTLLDAIAAAGGYGLVPVQQARPMLDRGQLVDLTPGRPTHVDLYWHHWQTELPMAKEITKLVVAHARAALAPDRTEAASHALSAE